MFTKQLDVDVRVKDLQNGQDKVYTGKGTVNLFNEANDILSQIEDPESLDEIFGLLNFAVEAKERAKIRAKVLMDVSGPEKAFEKQVKALMANREAIGKPITLEAATAKIKILMDMAD